MDDYEAALKSAGVEYVFHRYDGAGQAFQWNDNPERFRAEQSEDSWEKTLALFGEKLGVRGGLKEITPQRFSGRMNPL